QEAVKFIHNVKTLSGEGFVFEGLNHTSYRVSYTENPDCMSHHTHEDVVRLSEKSSDLTLHDLWRRAAAELGGEVVVEFSREVLHSLRCERCGVSEELFAPVGTVPYERGRCATCGEMRAVQAIHNYSGVEAYGVRKLNELGLPEFDLFVARNESRERAYLPCGDAVAVLGNLATAKEGA
ncbi:MAG: hypothetical protein ACRD3E_04560, partial [Terriglobales bacterium]